MKTPLSFIIPTRDEDRNITRALRSVLDWADQVFVLDSFSNDRTCNIAAEMGAVVVQHEFENFSSQKNWALDNLPLRNDWVFFLDADETVTADLRAEIVALLKQTSGACDGYYVGMRHFFMGAPLDHGGWYPNLRLLFFKHRLGRYESRIVHEHLVLQGRTGRLKELLVHDDRKGIHRYFERHNVYSTMEALEARRSLVEERSAGSLAANMFGSGPERRRALKQWAYRHVRWRPLFKFLWAYILKRGFLDGPMGFTYCMLQAFYELQVSLKLRELLSDPASPMLRYMPPDVEKLKSNHESSSCPGELAILENSEINDERFSQEPVSGEN